MSLLVHYPLTKGIEYKESLIDYSTWQVGTTGSQIGFPEIKDPNEHDDSCEIILDKNPWGKDDIIWSKMPNHKSGTLSSDYIQIDSKKTYRISVWMKRKDVFLESYTDFRFLSDGVSYADTTSTLPVSNPNFYQFNTTILNKIKYVDGEWALLIGFVNELGVRFGYQQENGRGLYNMSGAMLHSVDSYTFLENASTLAIRFISQSRNKVSSEKHYWYRPRIDIMDGTEPTLNQLLKGEENPNIHNIWEDIKNTHNNLDIFNKNNSIKPSINGKIGGCLEKIKSSEEFLRSQSKIKLDGDFTYSCWCKIDNVLVNTVSGIFGNHDNTINKNLTLQAYAFSALDYRLGVAIGDGITREYDEHYGVSNIKNKWSHLCVRYDSINKKITMLVNGIQECSFNYNLSTTDDYLYVFYLSTYKLELTSNNAIGKLNDIRIYDEYLSDKEVYELSKAKILHYKNMDIIEKTKEFGLINNIENEYYGGELKTLGVYYNIDLEQDRIVATNQPSGGPLPGWKVSVNEKNNYLIVTGETNLIGSILFYYRGFSYDNVSIVNQSYMTSTISDGKYEFKINLNNDNVSYYNIGIGDTGTSNYYLQNTSIKIVDTKIIDSSDFKNDGNLKSFPPIVKTDSVSIGKKAIQHVLDKTSYINTNIEYHMTNETDMSVSLWIKPSVQKHSVIMGTSQYEWSLCIDDNQNILFLHWDKNGAHNNIKVLDGDTNLYKTNNNCISYDKYNHICFIWNKEEGIKVFVNKKLELQMPILDSTLNMKRLGETIHILDDIYFLGNEYHNNSNSVNDVRIYTTALSDKDVFNLYGSRFNLDNQGSFTAYNIETIDDNEVPYDKVSLNSNGIFNGEIDEIGPTTDLMGHWDNSLKDYSENNNDLTNFGVMEKSTYMDFDGNSFGRTDTLDPFNYDYMTGVAMIITDGTKMGENIIFGKEGSFLLRIVVETNRIYLSSAFWVSSSVSWQNYQELNINKNEWTFVAVKWDGVNISMYINNNVYSIGFTNGVINKTYDSCFGIGARKLQLNNKGTYNFKGKMKNIRIYNTMLSHEEIITLYKLSTGTTFIKDNTLYVNNVKEE